MISKHRSLRSLPPLSLAAALLATPSGAGSQVLWYRQPAAHWEDALPLGNGRLGAMVFRRLKRECIQLNENTLRAGGSSDPNNTNALAALTEVRRLIFGGKHTEGD